MKIRAVVFVLDDDKKKKGKGRYTKSQVRYISPICRAGPFGPISTKIGTIVGVHGVIIQSKFGFNILRGFRSTGGRNFRFPIDFAGHRYNSAAQPVIGYLAWYHSKPNYRSQKLHPLLSPGPNLK